MTNAVRQIVIQSIEPYQRRDVGLQVAVCCIVVIDVFTNVSFEEREIHQRLVPIWILELRRNPALSDIRAWIEAIDCEVSGAVIVIPEDGFVRKAEPRHIEAATAQGQVRMKVCRYRLRDMRGE